MAGLEPARACYGPTDFKSVASAISPHRRISKVHSVQELVQDLKNVTCDCKTTSLKCFRLAKEINFCKIGNFISASVQDRLDHENAKTRGLFHGVEIRY
jgi:hypothetical protein